MEGTLTPNLVHKELIAEIGWPIEKYSEVIQNKIQALAQMEADFAANPAPGPEDKLKIDKASARLWHDIKDYEEAGRPDDTGEAVIVAPELPTNEPPASTGAEGSGDETPAASRRRGIIRRGRAK